jgi:hypothetical protein
MTSRAATSSGLAARAHTAHASVTPRIDSAKLPSGLGTARAAPFVPAPTNTPSAAGAEISCRCWSPAHPDFVRLSQIWDARVHKQVQNSICLGIIGQSRQRCQGKERREENSLMRQVIPLEGPVSRLAASRLVVPEGLHALAHGRIGDAAVAGHLIVFEMLELRGPWDGASHSQM